jgi:hypothetical protein
VEIEKPYMKAYILSDIACALALVDTEEAAGVAAKINKRHADARFSAWMQIASRTSAQDNLEKAAAIAEEIKERYDRAKALGRIASAMTPLNPERALELAEKIEYPYIRDEALSLLAKEWPKNRKKEVPDFIGNIHNPFLQGKAYKETALRINQKNPKKAEKLLMKATSLAEEIKSGPLLWDIATTWAKINPDKLYDLLARTEGHEVYRSRGLTEIALKEWGSDRIRSEMVLEMAVKTAERVDDAYHRSDLLREISMEWTKIDRVKAETVFRKAVEAAEKIEIAVPFIGS